MHLLGVEMRAIRATFRQPVGTSAATHDRRPLLFVRVVGEGVDGWGECGAMAAGTVVDPPLREVWRKLMGGAVERLFEAARARDGAPPPAAQVARLFDWDAVGRMTGAVLEMAVLDAELRDARVSLADRMGAGDHPVAVGTVVGIPADRRTDTVLSAVTAAVSAGFRRVRLKIEPGWDVEPVRSVRREYPLLDLQVDANGAYRLDGDGERSADRLDALDEYGLVCIEQPLPPADLPSHADLADRLDTPICLDESLTTVRRLNDAIRYGSCEVACLKPARLGGVFAARQAQEVCRAAGIPAFVGGFFEDGLGRSVNAALAALPGFTLPGDLSDPIDYLDSPLVRYEGPERGVVRPPTSPGVGPAPDAEMLESRTVAGAWYPFSG